MCNRFESKSTYRNYVEAFERLNLPILSPGPERAPNLEPLPDVRPTDIAPVLRPIDGGLELVQLRWGLIPWFHKKNVKDWKMLTTNCRCETAASTATFKGPYARRRCLIPATAYFEWTGEKGAKTKWRFVRSDHDFFCIAGLWDRAHTLEGTVESFTMITTPAGADSEPYHDRQPLVLRPEAYSTWLDPNQAADPLFAPEALGFLNVERAN